MQLRNRWAVLAMAGVISGAGLTVAAAGASGHPTAASGHPTAASALPRTMTGQLITARSGTLARGTVLKSSTIFSTRVFRTNTAGFALATRRGADYPVLTTNAGTTWRIAGPALHVDAADGPAEVDSVGVNGPRMDYAYASGAIDVTSNGGASWYQVFPEGTVTAVVKGARGLAAYIQALTTNGTVSGVYQYVSTDGGRHWTLSDEIDG